MCKELSELDDYMIPSAPAALLKAVILYAGVVVTHAYGTLDTTEETASTGSSSNTGSTGSLGSTGSTGSTAGANKGKGGKGPSSLRSHRMLPSLSDQLAAAGGGIVLESWSNLPQGSGCGTSSILAGCLLEAVGEVMGRPFSRAGLVHSVLMVEQMLTTGGGWQDQVGALTGGAKIGRSAAALPLHVSVEQITVDPAFYETLNVHLVGVFTGRPRLARNLLQDVIRRWYSRLPEIVETAAALTENAERAAEAFKAGDIVALGESFSAYWAQKKRMAAGCEPTTVTEMMRVLEPHCHGMSMGGAGGGGFMFVIAKDTWGADAASLGRMREVIRAGCDPSLVDVADLHLHTIRIDTTGPLVTRTMAKAAGAAAAAGAAGESREAGAAGASG